MLKSRKKIIDYFTQMQVEYNSRLFSWTEWIGVAQHVDKVINN